MKLVFLKTFVSDFKRDDESRLMLSFIMTCIGSHDIRHGKNDDQNHDVNRIQKKKRERSFLGEI